jgi:hypothetical protein
MFFTYLKHYLISREIGKLHGRYVCSLLTLWIFLKKTIGTKKRVANQLSDFSLPNSHLTIAALKTNPK